MRRRLDVALVAVLVGLSVTPAKGETFRVGDVLIEVPATARHRGEPQRGQAVAAERDG